MCEEHVYTKWNVNKLKKRSIRISVTNTQKIEMCWAETQKCGFSNDYNTQRRFLNILNEPNYKDFMVCKIENILTYVVEHLIYSIFHCSHSKYICPLQSVCKMKSKMFKRGNRTFVSLWKNTMVIFWKKFELIS